MLHSGPEGAAGGWVDGAGDVPADGDVGTRGGGVGHGDGGKQGLGVGVLGIPVDFFRRGQLHDFAQIHDGDPVGDVFDDGEIVRDEKVTEAHVALEVHEEIEDLALHTNIKCGDGFVADDEPGLKGDGAGDADALALAAGKFERITVAGSRRQADFFEEFGSALAASGGGVDLMDQEGLLNDAGDGLALVEGFCGILENHLADFSEIAGGGMRSQAMEGDLASSDRSKAGDGFA